MYPLGVPDVLRDLLAAVKAHRERTGEGPTVLAVRCGMSRTNLANVLARLERGEPVEIATAQKVAAGVGHELRLVKVRQK